VLCCGPSARDRCVAGLCVSHSAPRQTAEVLADRTLKYPHEQIWVALTAEGDGTVNIAVSHGALADAKRPKAPREWPRRLPFAAAAAQCAGSLSWDGEGRAGILKLGN